METSTPQAAVQRSQPVSAELKAEIIQACLQPGITMASVARAYQLKEHLVRDWVRRYKQDLAGLPASTSPLVPVTLTVSQPVPPVMLQFTRGKLHLCVQWPGELAEMCLSVLRESLR